MLNILSETKKCKMCKDKSYGREVVKELNGICPDCYFYLHQKHRRDCLIKGIAEIEECICCGREVYISQLDDYKTCKECVEEEEEYEC